MPILVTGCAGFIGSHLAERLLNEGHDVVGIDNFDPYYSVELKKKNIDILKKHKNFRFIKGSFLDDADLKKAMKDITLVYHLGAVAGVRPSIENPMKYMNINVLGTSKILEMARMTNIEKVVVASSSSVYGEVKKKDLPMHEGMKPAPISPYACSKVMGEELCQMYTDVYSLPTVSLRFFTVYGPRQRPDEAFSKFIKKILSGEGIEIYGEPGKTPTRDFTFVEDIVNGTILSAAKGRGIYNLGGAHTVSVDQMVATIREVIGFDFKVTYVGRQKGDVSHTSADISKARKELGYEPKICLKEGIKRHVEWFKNG